MLKYEAISIDNDLELIVSNQLNPAQFLYGEPDEELLYTCLEVINYQTKIREDLTDQLLQGGKGLYIDGSSCVIQGHQVSGYAIVHEELVAIEKGKLPSNWAAQACELYPLKRALEIITQKRGTIYIDSKYAFGVVHTFGKIWEERGLLNSK